MPINGFHANAEFSSAESSRTASTLTIPAFHPFTFSPNFIINFSIFGAMTA